MMNLYMTIDTSGIQANPQMLKICGFCVKTNAIFEFQLQNGTSYLI